MRKTLALMALMLAVAAPAFAEKGGSIVSIGLSHGTADLYDPSSAGDYISAFPSPELGITGEYWYLFTDDYAFAIQGTYGFSSETDKPGDTAAGAPDHKFTTTSYKVRVGGDRVGKIGERFTWFMGPGLEFWSGKAKFEGFGGAGSSVETQSVSRFGVSGRFGGVMKLSDKLGIQGQIGDTFGYASATDQGSKATWYPSSFTASWGLAISF